MKKFLFSLLAAGVVLVVPVAASAQSVVAGKVTHNGTPVNGANVTAVCNTNSKDAYTNQNGDYAVEFAVNECPDGETATVVASKNGMGGTGNGQVDGVTATLNIAIVNVAVPEFGVIAGIVGSIGAAGAFLVIRRRQSTQVGQEI
jgi:hypothetical protein